MFIEYNEQKERIRDCEQEIHTLLTRLLDEDQNAEVLNWIEAELRYLLWNWKNKGVHQQLRQRW